MQHTLQGTTQKDDGLTQAQRRMLNNLSRANEIMEDHIDSAGNAIPFHLWPRNARRKFSRLTSKVRVK